MRTKNRDIEIKQIMVVPWTRCTYYGYCRPQSPNKTNSHTDLKLNRMSKTNWMGRMNCKNVKLYIGNRESSFHTFSNILCTHNSNIVPSVLPTHKQLLSKTYMRWNDNWSWWYYKLHLIINRERLIPLDSHKLQFTMYTFYLVHWDKTWLRCIENTPSFT